MTSGPETEALETALHPADPALTSGEIKRRAASGVALLVGRGVAFKVLGLLGNLVLARLLVPADFGVVALGLVLISVGQLLADAPIGAALVMRKAPPEHGELRAIAGVQLLVATMIGAIGIVASLAVGGSGQVTALMMVALPIIALRGPILLILQRQLAFGIRVKIEIVEVLLYLIFSIGLAFAGFGVWSLVMATIIRGAGGTAAAWIVNPGRSILPSLEFSRLRPLLGFGLRMQAGTGVQITHDLALTAGIGAIGGLTALGLWSFAGRILQIPQLLFDSLWAVAFPAFSRLSDTDEDLKDLLERTIAATALGVGFLLTPVVASAPAAVPVAFGDAWTDVSVILPGAALAYVLSGPINISIVGYLYSIGDAATPLRGFIVSSIVRLAVVFALLPSMGVVAIGIGLAAGSLAELPVYVQPTKRSTGARFLRQTMAATLAGALGATAGWVVAQNLGETVVSMLAAALIGLAIYIVVLTAIARPQVRVAVAMARSAVVSRRTNATPEAQQDPAGSPRAPKS